MALRPCEYGAECPHYRAPSECDAANKQYDASKCPSSVSPHAIHRGSITYWLREDVPKPVISDRADVSAKVLDQHYDKRTAHERMEQRRQLLEEIQNKNNVELPVSILDSGSQIRLPRFQY